MSSARAAWGSQAFRKSALICVLTATHRAGCARRRPLLWCPGLCCSLHHHQYAYVFLVSICFCQGALSLAALATLCVMARAVSVYTVMARELFSRMHHIVLKRALTLTASPLCPCAVFNIVITFLFQHGSAVLVWIGMAASVPVAYMAFAIPAIQSPPAKVCCCCGEQGGCASVSRLLYRCFMLLL